LIKQKSKAKNLWRLKKAKTANQGISLLLTAVGMTFLLLLASRQKVRRKIHGGKKIIRRGKNDLFYVTHA